VQKTIFILFLLSTILSGAKAQGWDGQITILNEDLVNSSNMEFSPTQWGDFIVFVQARNRQKLFDKNIDTPFFDLVFCNNNNGTLSHVKTFDSAINTPYHEGPAHFTKDGNALYFTRVDYDGTAFNLDKNKTVTLKLFYSTYKNGKWSKPIKLPLNMPDVASCHPTLNPTADLLVFASDRPGGYGKMDLYISTLKNGSWSTPINLGPEINSEDNDWFPSINERGLLFYASDRTDKQLDIYLCKGEERNWHTPTRLPNPINTPYDDFGITTNRNATQGYLSSNRPGGLGQDDLYQFASSRSLYEFVDSTYNLIVLDIKDAKGVALSNAVVKVHTLDESELENFSNRIFNPKDDNFLLSRKSDSLGLAEINLDSGYKLITISAPLKEDWQQIVSAKWGGAHYSVTLKNIKEEAAAEPHIVYVEKEVSAPSINNVKVEVGAIIVFENIYYDYNSYNLTRGAKIELNKLVQLMQDNPTLKIQLSAHTDSRGDKKYNLELSYKRSASARDYLISQGIDQHRIQSIGYGEEQPRNHCIDGVKCSEAEHIYNRRTEVKILEK